MICNAFNNQRTPMTSKRFFMLLIMSFMGMLLVPTLQAQGVNIDFQEIIRRLGPSQSFPNILFDILRYLIFILAFITMLMVPDKQLLASLLMTAVLGVVILVKLEIFSPVELPTLALNCALFVIPFIVAGMLRGRNRMARAVYPALLTGLLGGGYFFLFWALVQRGA
jgi:hypothetical protein